MTTTTTEPRMDSDPLALPIGYYALRDPTGDAMTYWRRSETKGRQEFTPWPSKTEYGPLLNVPAGLRGQQRSEWVTWWYWEVRHPWDQAVAAALLADPVAAARRFAEFATRCCCCGRTLTDARSKVYGIGPECRTGITVGTLAALYVPAVAAAHATLGTEQAMDAALDYLASCTRDGIDWVGLLRMRAAGPADPDQPGHRAAKSSAGTRTTNRPGKRAHK